MQRSRAPKGTNKWWSKGGHWGWRNMKRIKGYGVISTITSTTEWSYQDKIDRATVWQLDSGPTLLLGLGAGTCECSSAGAFGKRDRLGEMMQWYQGWNAIKQYERHEKCERYEWYLTIHLWHMNDIKDRNQYVLNGFWMIYEWYKRCFEKGFTDQFCMKGSNLHEFITTKRPQFPTSPQMMVYLHMC